MRPPMVRRRRGRRRGDTARRGGGRGWSRAPVWDPPRRVRLVRGFARQGVVEALQLGVVQAAGRAGGVETRLEEGLVDQQVPEAGDLRLVHEPGLEGRPGFWPSTFRSRAQVEADGVGAETVFLGVQLRPAEPAGTPSPGGRRRRRSARRGGPRPRPPGWTSTRASRCPPARPRARPDLPNFSPRTGPTVYPHPPALSVSSIIRLPIRRGPEPAADERLGHDIGRQPALQPPGVGRHHGGDLAVQGPLGQRPVRLDLDQLRQLITRCW